MPTYLIQVLVKILFYNIFFQVFEVYSTLPLSIIILLCVAHQSFLVLFNCNLIFPDQPHPTLFSSSSLSSMNSSKHESTTNVWFSVFALFYLTWFSFPSMLLHEIGFIVFYGWLIIHINTIFCSFSFRREWDSFHFILFHFIDFTSHLPNSWIIWQFYI